MPDSRTTSSAPERHGFRLNHNALASCVGMIFVRKPVATFRDHALTALELSAERAGYALACPFSTSAELEAAEIRSKLDAGCYGPRHRRRRLIRIALAASLAAAALLLILV
jgi:hypothetical protein